MSALNFDCRIEPTGDEPINTRMTAHVTEDFRLVKVSFTPHRTENAAISRRRRPVDTVLVSLHQQGEIDVSQDGRSARIGPQELFFIDTTRPFTIDAGQMRCLSLYMSGAKLRSILPDIDQFTATAISAKPGAGAVFATMLESMYSNIAQFDDEGARRVAASIPHLLGAAIQSRTTDFQVARQSSEEAQVAQVRAFVLEHLADPNLGCEAISRGVSLSVRQIHQIFERQPATLMKWAWNERLHRCRADLASPAHRERSISEIASAWGFADPAHFSRAFKAAFELSPRAFRRLN
jgi:AraC-like DNA-binding protein